MTLKERLAALRKHNDEMKRLLDNCEQDEIASQEAAEHPTKALGSKQITKLVAKAYRKPKK